MPKKLVELEDSRHVRVVRPHEGPQTDFLETSADIAVYGGSAGGGKSYALLIDPLRDVDVTGFTCLVLRKESTQLSSGGGLWDTACDLYAPFHTETRQTPRMQHVFKSGAKIEFSHLQREDSTRSWDGAQLAEICFDELQHFSERQFWYMLSRNRSTCGVQSRMRATCNPDPDSFLVKLLAWWIDDEGYPIPERSGVIRWFIRDDNKMIWYDTYEEGYEANKERIDNQELYLKSFTFIRATLDDNPTLLEIDPAYKANLSSMFEYERKRLLLGNWYARPMAGELFKTTYWKYVSGEELPRKYKKLIRYWDRAATAPSDVTPDPDYTAGVLMGIGNDNLVYVLDVVRDRVEPYDVLQMIKRCAENDSRYGDVEIWLEQDPGSAGKQEVATLTRELAGFDVQRNNKRTAKLVYWKPFATQCKAGNVFLLKASWNGMFVDELAGVTDGSQNGHDDMADASSGAFMMMANILHEDDAIRDIAGAFTLSSY
jgi:predicted phage terminase large subunit-like protein